LISRERHIDENCSRRVWEGSPRVSRGRSFPRFLRATSGFLAFFDHLSGGHFAGRALLVHRVQNLSELEMTFFRGDSGTTATPQEPDVELGAERVRQQFVAPAAFQGNLRVPAEKRQTLGQFASRFQMRPDDRQAAVGRRILPWRENRCRESGGCYGT